MTSNETDAHPTTLGQSGANLLAHIASQLETPHNFLQDAEAAAARFDVSPFRLWLLFQSVDENQDGFISKKELVRALATSANTTTASSQPQQQEPPPQQPNQAQDQPPDLNYMTEVEEDDDSRDLERMPLQDIQALDELFDRIVCSDQEHANYQKSSSHPQLEEVDDSHDDITTTHQNRLDSRPPGISFPQFARIMRYLWLQQLLQQELDNASDPDNHYVFECVDYSSGYYRQKKIAGNVVGKRTRDFFTAPRHGHARMRWIDVPSGTFVPGSNNPQQAKDSQGESFRITIMRLAIKYRFHPTSVEDAIDLKYQEPKVNSFEHSLLDLGNFNCGTISWLRNAGVGSGAASLDEDTPSHQQLGDWAQDMNRPPLSVQTMPLPRPRPNMRASSTASFVSYQKEAEGEGRVPNIPEFVMAEGEDDINMNEGRHYFITIPMFELSRRSQTSLDLYKEAIDLLPAMQLQPLMIEVNEATLGIFVASLPEANLVVTCSTKWRPTRIKPFKDYVKDMKTSGYSTRSTISKRQNKLSSNNNAAGYGRTDGGGWDDHSQEDSSNSNHSEGDQFIQSMLQDEKLALERVKSLLKKRHSIQRHRNSNWLMHAIIDAVVDNLVPISKIYEAQLQRLATRLFELQHRLSRQEVKEMIVMKRDLEWLQHELRPFARVIRHLIDDRNIGIEVTHYLEDVEDHLLRTLDELASYASECISLKDEYNAYLDRRMNDILYLLTVVTTLIVPGQFFTGYYGMNFEKDGELGIPMLRLGSMGVVGFWCITSFFTALVAVTMYRYNFFEKEMV